MNYEIISGIVTVHFPQPPTNPEHFSTPTFMTIFPISTAEHDDDDD